MKTLHTVIASTYTINNILYDQRNGLGNTPNGVQIDYFGWRVLMLPSMFLSLAAPSGFENLKRVMKDIQANTPIASPFLDLALDKDDEGIFLPKTCRVISHEGRHRMQAIMKLHGDIPIEVHLFFSGYRHRHISMDLLTQINTFGVQSEKTGFVKGPIWSKVL